MTSEQIYNDIKHNDCKKSYTYFKTKYTPLIKSKFTLNRCYGEAEDRFAHSFNKLYQKVKNDNLKNYSNLTGYFLMICKNNFLVETKRNKVKTYKELKDLDFCNKTDQKNSPEMTQINEDLINQLPEKLKIISQKIFLEDKNHQEVAKELNINYDNIRKYQYKAIKFLKSRTPKHYKEYLNQAA